MYTVRLQYIFYLFIASYINEYCAIVTNFQKNILTNVHKTK